MGWGRLGDTEITTEMLDPFCEWNCLNGVLPDFSWQCDLVLSRINEQRFHGLSGPAQQHLPNRHLHNNNDPLLPFSRTFNLCWVPTGVSSPFSQSSGRFKFSIQLVPAD
jgi:hypothetical protein